MPNMTENAYYKTPEEELTDHSQVDADHVFISEETESIDSGKIPIWQQLTLLAVLLFLLLGGVITPTITAFFQNEADAIPAAVPVPQEDRNEFREVGQSQSSGIPFSNINLQAQAVYVWDVQNQRVLYKKNEQEVLPLASVTKLMTALVAHELLEERAKVAIGNEAVAQYGNSGLSEGEVFNRLSLTDLTLMSSSNDGAYALAAAAGNTLGTNGATAFVHAMNIRAEELGLHHTSFKNPTGLDTSETESGAVGSAKDMAFLMEHIVQHEPDILTFTKTDQARVYSEDGTYHDTENTNYYINQIPGLIGSKTGYTDLAGGNLVVAFDAGLNRPIVITVLGSTRHERFTDVITLVEETQKQLTQE